jgi:hypothetical protein
MIKREDFITVTIFYNLLSEVSIIHTPKLDSSLNVINQLMNNQYMNCHTLSKIIAHLFYITIGISITNMILICFVCFGFYVTSTQFILHVITPLTMIMIDISCNAMNSINQAIFERIMRGKYINILLLTP